MKKTILILAALILSASLAYAVNQTATCPQDGETAYFTGNQKAAHTDGRGFPIGDNKYNCEYSHQYDGKTHVFWQTCE